MRHLLNLHRDADTVLEESVAREPAILGQLLQLDLDIAVWEDRIAGRPEAELLKNARKELALAIYAASSGLYRLGYDGIRLFLELSFAAVYFSANELQRRQWISDRSDFSWSKALDQADGVLSSSFVREFLLDAVDVAPTYADLALKSYRRCSQFVHGKLAVTKSIPENLTFSREVFLDWAATGRDSATATLFLLLCRYGSELAIVDDSELSSTIEHSFAQHAFVRIILGLPVDREENGR
ncbi:hypothetical protein [Actinomadura sp. B10D3]|uniref:hypothetical protein n=1 Tax=Actinomadura sp. B10D3 TaxID=3153557 RepID=UPI00325F4BFD